MVAGIETRMTPSTSRASTVRRRRLLRTTWTSMAERLRGPRAGIADPLAGVVVAGGLRRW